MAHDEIAVDRRHALRQPGMPGFVLASIIGGFTLMARLIMH